MAGVLNSYRYPPPAGGSTPSYVASNVSSPDSATTFVLPTGAATGDWVVMALGNYFPSGLGISGGDAANPWTYANTLHAYIAYKFLTAGDIGATFTVAGGSGGGNHRFMNCALYRDAVAAALKGSTQTSGATPASVAGFTPSASGRVVSIAKVDTDTPEPTLTPPSSFTKRSDTTNSADGIAVAIADRTGYTSGALAWTFTGGTPIDRNTQFVLELT